MFYVPFMFMSYFFIVIFVIMSYEEPTKQKRQHTGDHTPRQNQRMQKFSKHQDVPPGGGPLGPRPEKTEREGG